MADSGVNEEQAGFRAESGFETDDLGPIQMPAFAAQASEADQGPCLYLGPAGQRCGRRAVTGGFCAVHMPGATAGARIGKPSKWLAAIAGILGVLWPYIYDFVHELIRLFHPR
jgi:hypothetical protein